MAVNVNSDTTIIENEIEDRLLEYFSSRNVDLTDIFTAYTIKQVTFNSAWRYVYKCLFKPDKPQVNNRNSLLDYDDINALNRVCDAYIDLCFEYHIEPNYYGFSRLIGCSRETIDQWKNGDVRGEASKPWMDIVKKIYTASQNYTRAELENTPVGQITKANNDEEKGLLYSRTQAQAMLDAVHVDSPEQIAARHKQAALSMPKKPDL